MATSRFLAESDVAARSHLALQALDRFLETWNTRDAARWSTALHFPHVRPSAGDFRLPQTREEYEADVDFAQTLASGWRYTRWVDRHVVQVGLDKVHVAGHWRRCLEDGTPQVEARITYIVTEQDGRWRIQSRFAAGRAGLDGEAAAPNSEAALGAVSAFVLAINSHDPKALADSVHYPHVRIADGDVLAWESPEAFLAGPEPGRQRTWAETRISRAEVVQVAPRGATVALEYGRTSTEGELLAQYEALYLVTRRDDVWKVQARSSMGT